MNHLFLLHIPVVQLLFFLTLKIIVILLSKQIHKFAHSSITAYLGISTFVCNGPPYIKKVGPVE